MTLGLDTLGAEWSCHFCGRTRADAQISVVSRGREIKGPETTLAVAVTENRRYCNDARECVGAADEWRRERKP